MCDVDVDDQIVGRVSKFRMKQVKSFQFLRREMMRMKLIQRELVMLQMLLMLENFL